MKLVNQWTVGLRFTTQMSSDVGVFRSTFKMVWSAYGVVLLDGNVVSLKYLNLHLCSDFSVFGSVFVADEQAEVVREASLSKTVPPGPEESSTARIPLTVTFRPMNVPRLQIPSVDRYVTTEACGLPRDPGHCKGSRPRYYFNPLSKTCEPFAFSGCGGNQNNFVSLRDCLRICAENPPETGRFRSLFKAPTPDQSRTTYERKETELIEIFPVGRPLFL